jgi:hypothetical protein
MTAAFVLTAGVDGWWEEIMKKLKLDNTLWGASS